jgi:hypothetical protein
VFPPERDSAAWEKLPLFCRWTAALLPLSSPPQAGIQRRLLSDLLGAGRGGRVTPIVTELVSL